MIMVDQFMDIKSRHNNGQSIHSIAHDTGIARNTVRKVLRGEHSIQSRSRTSSTAKARASKLEPFHDYIRKRVQEFDLSAVRILPEIQAMGFQGSVHTVRRYIKSLKQDRARISLATVRFETPPGKQAQCDWGYVGKFPDSAGKLIDIYVLVMVLGYSRQLFARFTTSMKIPMLVECHQLAFEYFQGVPHTILYDNMSQVRSGPGRLNETFADFAGHCGFEIKTHRPYRPRTKGKVERMVDYVKDNFLNGRDFKGLNDLNTQSITWLDNTANVRLHGTTGQRPYDLWLTERTQLLDWKQVRPYFSAAKLDRKVGTDSFVSFEKSRYSVPPKFIGHTVEIIAQAGTITIRCADAIIAEHEQAKYTGQTIMDHEHMRELWLSTVAMVPLRGEPHCNVRLDESVEQCSLACFEEVCS